MSAANTISASREPDFSTVMACGTKGPGVSVYGLIQGWIFEDRSIVKIFISDREELSQETIGSLASCVAAAAAHAQPGTSFCISYPVLGKDGASLGIEDTLRFRTVKKAKIRAHLDAGIDIEAATRLIGRAYVEVQNLFPNAESESQEGESPFSDGSGNYFLAASVALIACAIAYYSWNNGPLSHGAVQ